MACYLALKQAVSIIVAAPQEQHAEEYGANVAELRTSETPQVCRHQYHHYRHHCYYYYYY
jgi:hypothetical protein